MQKKHLTKVNIHDKKNTIVDMKGQYLNLIKANYNKPTTNSILNYGKMKSFSFKIMKKKRMSFLAISLT